MKMNILLAGSSGALARCFRDAADANDAVTLHAPPESELDILNPDAIRSALASTGADTLLNCAAYTAVDKAESERPIAFRINEEGPRKLADACRETGTLLVHFSTDYVFGGDAVEPYPTDAERKPLGVYGESKAAGEVAIEASGCDFLLIRTAWLYTPYGNSFPKAILTRAEDHSRLSVVDDQTGAPTYGPDLVEATLHLLQGNHRGTFHATNSGHTTWYDFATELLRLAGHDNPIDTLSTDELNRPAPRPAYSVLSLQKLIDTGFTPRSWKKPIRDYLTAINYQLPPALLRDDFVE
jgi:dTDP-4-dehydrorhamnose reductase